MRLSRIRAGEGAALAGAVLVVVAGFLSHYRTDAGRSVTGWGVFGVSTVFELLGVLAALALVLATVTEGERGPALPVAGAVWTTFIGFLALLAALVRVLARPDHTAAVHAGALLTLLGALLITAGGWESMRDERTELYPPAAPVPRSPPPPA